MSEATASALPKLSGYGFVLSSADVIDEDIEVWKQEGYTLSDRTADGCIVFTFTGEPDAHPENLAASGVAVEAEEDSSSDTDTVFKGDSEVQPCVWRASTVGTPQEDPQKLYSLPGDKNQKVVVEVVFKHAFDRNYPDHTGLCLKLKKAAFGVEGSANDLHHKGHFVHRLVLIASPTDKWRTKVDHMTAEPSDDSLVETFSKQKTATRSLGVTVDPKNAISVQGGVSDSRGITSGSIPTHRWAPAKENFNNHSVTWTWELTHWKDGQPFSSSYPGKSLTFGRLPALPFTDLEYVALTKSSVEAEWMVENSKLEGVEEIDWDVSVKFHTASIQVKHVFGFRNRAIVSHRFQNCDDLPPLFLKITQKLTTPR